MSYNSESLFGLKIPYIETDAKYSFGWAGRNSPKDQTVLLGMKTTKARGVKEMMENVDDLGRNGWNGLSINLVMADRDGDIGYMLIAPVPVRKDNTPYISSRVLDGRKSTYDWEVDQNVPVNHLPRSFNPEKGYIVTANNRHTPDNA